MPSLVILVLAVLVGQTDKIQRWINTTVGVSKDLWQAELTLLISAIRISDISNSIIDITI